MKLATGLATPLLVLGLAACGSGSESQPAPSSEGAAATKPPAARQAVPPADTKATPARKSSTPAKPPRPPHVKPQITPAPRAVATFKGPKLTVAVGTNKVVPIAATVNPRTRFMLTILSIDGHAHKVTLPAPVGRTVDLPAKKPIAVPVPGLAAGSYALSVDGKSNDAVSVIDPRAAAASRPTKPGAIKPGAGSGAIYPGAGAK